MSDSADKNQEAEKQKPPQPPPPEMEEFRPPLPDHQTTPERTPTLPDYSALKTAISQFKASNHIGLGSSDAGSLSPGGFPVNPHQSFLCPSASWSSYTGSSSYAASPAYPASPCSSTQEQEFRPPATVTAAAAVSTPPVVATPGPLANLASLPLEVKPPPPPHLMMLGHTYGSDSGAAGAAGSSPLPNSLPYTDQSDKAQPGYTAGVAKNASATPTQHDRTPSGPDETLWGTTGTSTPGLVEPSGLPKTAESIGGSAAASHGGRTHMNCANGLVPPVGIPTRGGAAVRPKLPPHLMCGVGFGCVGGVPGQMDHGPMRGSMAPGFLGGYRGRGPPPVGFWPRPGRGHDRGGGSGGGPCSWGYPGRGGPYYSNYTYSHNYAPE